MHWITQVVEGPDGRPWYRIRDEMLYADNLDYYVPASHVYIFKPEELLPISPEIPAGKNGSRLTLICKRLQPSRATRWSFLQKFPPAYPIIRKGRFHGKPPADVFISKINALQTYGGGILTTNMEEYVLPGTLGIFL